MSFQTSVMTVAIIILLLVLVVVGYLLNRNKTSAPFPPIIGECPDYWASTVEGTNTVCKNIKGLGKAECSKTMNFNMSPWNGPDGMCNKNKWANTCQVTWDGITNNANACAVNKV